MTDIESSTDPASGDAADTHPLALIPAKWWTPDPSIVGKLPRGGNGSPASCNVCGGWHKPGAIHLDYVGHADLTRALIEIDPEWDWEPLAYDTDGSPLVTQRKGQLVMWGKLTLLGRTRLCVGTCDADKPEAEKELIGDLLRNGGMRFGVFGSLWSKAAGWTDDDEPVAPRQQRGQRAQRTQSTAKKAGAATAKKAGAATAAKPAAASGGVVPLDELPVEQQRLVARLRGLAPDHRRVVTEFCQAQRIILTHLVAPEVIADVTAFVDGLPDELP